MPCKDLSTAAGTKLYYSATLPATYDEAGYAALTWLELADVSSIGEIGKEYAIVTFKALATRTTCKRKGTYDFGQISLGLGFDGSSVGQAAMFAALDSDLSYAFKIQFNDATDTLVVPTKTYFPAQVSKFKVNPGSDPDAFLTGSINLEVDGDMIFDFRSAT